MVLRMRKGKKAKGQFQVSFESPEHFIFYLLLLQYGFFFCKAPYRNFRSMVQARELIPKEGAKTVHNQKFTTIDMASETCLTQCSRQLQPGLKIKPIRRS